MESRYGWEPITTPAGWTAEQDVQEFIYRFGESDDYFEEARERVEVGAENLSEGLDRGLVYFGDDSAPGAEVDIPDKIDRLERLITVGLKPEAYREGAPTKRYRDRFEEDLRYCWLRWKDYERITQRYNRGGEHNWLLPLVDLADSLGTAAMNLDESLGCEHNGYEEQMGEPSWLRKTG